MPRHKPRNDLDNVNLKKYPALLQSSPSDRLTLGDLHGNALMMLFFLVRNGVLTLKDGERDYDNFVKLYDEFFTIVTSSLFLNLDPSSLFRLADPLLPDNQFNQIIQSINPDADPALKLDGTRMQNEGEFYAFAQLQAQHIEFMLLRNQPIDLNHFPFQSRLEKIAVKYKLRLKKIIDDIAKIIDSATVTKEARKIRLIGDTLADRGACDLFTLLILNKLMDNPDLDVVILISNHDFLFLKNWVLTKNVDFKGVAISTLQAFSMQTLCALVKTGLIQADHIDTLCRKAYLPRLRIADHSEDSIHTHAPFHCQRFYALAHALSLKPQNNLFADVDSMKNAIDKMNDQFRRILMMPDPDINPWKHIWEHGDALYQFIWGRDAAYPHGLQIGFTHGHEGTTNASSFNPSRDDTLNLNSKLGQGLLDAALAAAMQNNSPGFLDWYNLYFKQCLYVDSPDHPLAVVLQQKRGSLAEGTSSDGPSGAAAPAANSGAAAPAASSGAAPAARHNGLPPPLPPHLIQQMQQRFFQQQQAAQQSTGCSKALGQKKP